MHELSICQALLEQVNQQAKHHNATRVTRIVLRVGPLSGVDPGLLADAFSVIRHGTVASDALLVTELQSVRIRCNTCFHEAETSAQWLACPQCQSNQTTLIGGDELLLATMDLEINEPDPAIGEFSHV